MLAALFALLSRIDCVDAALEITLKAHEISMLVDFLNMTFSEILRISEDLKTLLLHEFRFSLESQ